MKYIVCFVLPLLFKFSFGNGNYELDQNELWNAREYNETLSPFIQNITVLSPCTLSVTWSCDECTKATNYVVYWSESESGSGSGSEIIGIDAYTYVIEGLIAGTSYEVYVSAVYEEGIEYRRNSSEGTTKSDDIKIFDLEVDDVTDTRMQLTWDTTYPECAVQYSVKWNGIILCNDGKLDSGADTTTEQELILYQLTPYTNYSISVAAVTTDGIGNEEIKDGIVTDEGEPGFPESLKAEVLSKSSIKLTWNPPLECNGILKEYFITWILSPDDLVIGNSNTTETFYQIDDLLACGIYTFNVQATTEAGFGDPAVTTEETLSEPPPDIVYLESSDVTSNSVNFEWSPPETHCPVFNYILNGTGTILWEDNQDNVFVNISGENSVYNLTDLIPWTNYYFYILAETEGGQSVSNLTNFETLEDKPSEPIHLTPTVLSPTELQLSWEPPEMLNGNFLYYTVVWDTEEIESAQSKTTNETEMTLSDLLPCAHYEIAVTGATIIGEGNPAATHATMDVEIPPPPKEINCKVVDAETIDVNWIAPSTTCNVAQYMITTSGQILWNNGTNVFETETVGLQKRITGLVPYTEYTITVKAITSEDLGYGPASEPCVETTDEDVPGKPTDLTVVKDSTTSSKFSITWENPVERNGIIRGFNVNLNDGFTKYINYDNSTIVYRFNFEDLESNYHYTVNVSAETSVGSGEASEVAAITDSDSNVGLALGITIPLLIILAALGFGYYYRDDVRKKIRTLRTHPIAEHDDTNDFDTTPIPLQQLRTYINKLENVRNLESEFNHLGVNSYKGSTVEGDKPENARLNRYANIIPFDFSRVPLTRGLTTYINANYINSFLLPKFFVATQGPKDITLDDFWNLVWQEHIDVIVMLTACVEDGKDKCSQYWPKSLGYGTDIGRFTIQNINEEITSLYAVRVFEMLNRDENTKRLVKQYQYLTWPDFGVPSREEDLLKLLSNVKQNLTQNRSDSKMLVHCSAGVGRTGTFICLWNIIEAIDYGVQSLSISKEVLELRKQRVLMVQSKEQYRYLCKCVLEYFENQSKWQIKPRDSTISSTDSPQYQSLNEANTSTSAFYNMSFDANDDFEGNLI